METNNNVYRVNWRGIPQPLGSNSFHSAKMYILNSLSQGGCTLSQFDIYDNWGKLKTKIIHQKDVDPTLTENYEKLF